MILHITVSDKDLACWRGVHRRNEDTAPSISPSTAMKYVFVLIWSLIPSNPFHGPFPYANTSGEKKGERVAECGWVSFRGRNIPPRRAWCVYIIRFNWIVLHQCQARSLLVCLQRLVFFLTEGLVVFFPPTASQHSARNKVPFRIQSQTISKRETWKGTNSRYVKASRNSYASRFYSKKCQNQ